MNKLNLANYYDSFGNVKRHYDNSNYFTFSYDGQNRLTSAYSRSYGYDNAGRLTAYEGTGYSAFDGHAILKSGYSYDANGNLISRAGKTLVWNHENRLQEVKSGSVVQESYLYDDNWIRVKRTAGGASTYFPFPHYEYAGSTAIKYYFPSTSSGQASTVNELHNATAARYTTSTRIIWAALS